MKLSVNILANAYLVPSKDSSLFFGADFVTVVMLSMVFAPAGSVVGGVNVGVVTYVGNYTSVFFS